MENKYYVPEIKELHPGFEIELNGKGVEGLNWFKRIVEPDDIGLYAMYIDPRRMSRFDIKMGIVPKPAHNIRVKYLDKEDIESFRFIFTDIFGYTDRIFCIIPRIDHRYEICLYDDPLDVRFHGTIKNKSELKVLLKQLEIR